MDMIRYTPLDTHIRMPANIRYDILKAVREREYKHNFCHRYAPWFMWSYFRATHSSPSLRVYKSIPVNTEGSYIQLVLQPNNLYRLKPAPLLRVYKSIPATRCRVMTRIGPKLCGYTKVYPQQQRIFESCCKVAPATLPILWVYKNIPATAFGFGYLESCPRKHRRRLGINT